MVFITNARFTQRFAQKSRVCIDQQLLQSHFTLLKHSRIDHSNMRHLFGEDIQLVISTDHLYFVHRKQTDRTTRNVNPTFSPKNGDYMHSILLTQIQFKQGFSGPSRLSRYFKISQMQIS